MKRETCKKCGKPFDKKNTIRKRVRSTKNPRRVYRARGCRNCQRAVQAAARERERRIRAEMHGATRQAELV